MASLIRRVASFSSRGLAHRQTALFSSPLAAPVVAASASFLNGSCGSTLLNILGVRHASKKAGGSSNNTKDSGGKSLGVKRFGSEFVKAGNIIMRQRGCTFHPGCNVIMGRDHTISAKVEGFVKFTYLRRPFRRKNRIRTFINVIPSGSEGADVQQWNEENEKKYLMSLLVNRKKLHYKTVPDLQKQAARDALVAEGKVPRLDGAWKDIIRKEENRGKEKESYSVKDVFGRGKIFRPPHQRLIGVLDKQQRRRSNSRRI